MNAGEAKKPTKFFGLSRNTIFMGAVSFLNDVSSDMVFPFIPIFLTSVLGAPVAVVGIIEGVADATASMARLVSGRLSDVWRRKKPFIVFGYGLSGIAKPVLAFATAPWHVFLVRFFDRLGKGTREAPRDALLSVSVERGMSGRAFGFHRAADTFGATLGPVIAFFILPVLHNDLRSLFLLSFVASVCAVVILQVFVFEVRSVVAVPDAIPAEAPPPFRIKQLGLPFFVFLASATILALGKTSEAFLLLRARDLGVALALLPILYALYSLVAALLSTPAGILADRIGRRNTFMIGMILFSGTSLLFARVTSEIGVWVLFAIYGIYMALTEGVGRAIIADLVEERLRGTAYGIYHACTGMALLPAGILIGFLWGHIGASSAFMYSAILGLVAFILFLIVRIVFRPDRHSIY